jgi:plastocyanin
VNVAPLVLALVAGALPQVQADPGAAPVRCAQPADECHRLPVTPATGPAPVGMTPFRVAPATPGAPDTDPAPAPGPGPAAATRLGVTAREWSLVLSRTTLPAGDAIVELDNMGEDAHNLRIERVDGGGSAFDVPLAESGEVKSGRTTVAPGEYKLYCALPGHEAQGMRARLNVSG